MENEKKEKKGKEGRKRKKRGERKREKGTGKIGLKKRETILFIFPCLIHYT